MVTTTGNDLNISQAGYVAFDGTATFFGRTFQAGTGISLSNPDGIAGNTTITATGGGSNIDAVNLQTGTTPIAPTAGAITFNGAVVAAGTHPVRTDGTGASTMALEVQISQAIASTDATKIGLAAFDSGAFSVDANGFVTLAGGTEAIDSIGVDATSGGGTNPVLPTAAGLVTVNGARIAAGSNPIRTVSTAANVYQVQVQTSQAIASTDATKVGLSNFNSAQFSVDANGFVSIISPVAFTWSEVSGSFVSLASHGYFITATASTTLPASPTEGDTIKFSVDTANFLTITANTGQTIRLNTSVTATAGNAVNVAQGSSIELVYKSTGTVWMAVSANGNWTLT